ncbi:zinc finger, CCHC-type [Artemisia annua]|uniref:Zinc finger, CCHC-type n=1 Tax=Artemisia annua TaxID=35608 RepID=A0A2U1KUP9_ARTAN|nr:zinc finger, CCHC-type [Artemisia annua]
MAQSSPSVSQKEAEMKILKNQLQDLKQQHKQKRISTLIDDPWRLPSTPFVGVSFNPQPLPRSYTYAKSPSLNIWATEKRKLKNATRKNPTSSQESHSAGDIEASSKAPDVPLPRSYTYAKSPSLNIWATEKRKLKNATRKNPTSSQESHSAGDIEASSKAPDVLPIEKVNPVSSFLNSVTQANKTPKPDVGETTEQFDPDEYMANQNYQNHQNQEDPTEFPKSDIKQYFTFDDIPPSKWRERSIEMLTWCTVKMQYYSIDTVIKRFVTRLQGRLRDWYQSLGEYRQLQLQQSNSPEEFIGIIYSEFIGSPFEHTICARDEFLKMKCCSFQKKEVEKTLTSTNILQA